MTPIDALITKVLELDEHCPVHYRMNLERSVVDLRNAAPRLARALRVAVEVLKFYAEWKQHANDEPSQLGCAARYAIEEIAKLVEE